MQRDLEAYLWDIAEAIRAIRAFTASMSSDEYLASALVQAAVERKFEIIGEALRQAKTLYPGSTDALPDVQSAMGLRNHLAHGYFSVNQEMLWEGIQNDLPTLDDAVRRQLGKSELPRL